MAKSKMGEKSPPVEKIPDGEQLKIAGFKPATIEAVESAFDEYMDARDERAKTTKAMGDAKDALLITMKEHKVPSYGKKHGKASYIAVVESSESIVVKKVKPDREA